MNLCMKYKNVDIDKTNKSKKVIFAIIGIF